MIIISIFGGIGNQMFQYAFGRCMAIENNSEFKYDYTYNLVRNDFDPNDIQSIFNLFNLQGQQASESEIKRFKFSKNDKFTNKLFFFINKLNPYTKHRHLVERNNKFDERVFKIYNTNLYLSGYWQSEKYFISISDTIRKDFEFGDSICQSNLNWSEKIQQTNSISVHLRGRDYVTKNSTNKQHFTCDLEYYKKAFSIIKKKVNNPHFYIFSDDLEWANLYLIDFQNENFTYVTGNNWNTSPINDMYLMSICKHNIIANSSFSWWAAWLNKNLNKTIICPGKWHNNKQFSFDDITPTNWIKI